MNKNPFKTTIIAVIIERFPKLLYPERIAIVPETISAAKYFRVLLMFLLPLSIFIKIASKTGVITRATKSEDPNTIIRVIGKYCINSPIIPGHKASGTKAARVVAVEAMIGQATSPIPF